MATSNKDRLRIFGIVTIIMFVISLIPILYIAFYSHPLFDDYVYSLGVREVVLSDNCSLVNILKSVFNNIIDTYKTWQGTYTAVFLFSLQPGVYRIPVYWLTPFIIIGALVFSNIILGIVVAEKVFNGRKLHGVIIALVISEFQIQLVPYIREAFYWYNGGIYYSFFYALEVVEVSLLILIWKRDRKLLFGAFAIILGFLISGGNLSNALTNAMFSSFFVLISILFDRKKIKIYIPIFVFILAGLMINIASPGNSIRANAYNQLPAFIAIWESVKYAFISIIRWTGWAQLGLALFLVLFSYPLLKKSGCEFKYPIIGLIISFGFFAAQATPPFYAMSNCGALRQIDMYYYSYYAFFTFNVLYIEGWAIKKVKPVGRISEKVGKITVISLYSLATIAVFVGIYQFGLKNTAFCMTFLDLKSGRAQNYDAQFKEIEKELYEADEIAYVKDMDAYPNSFYNLQLEPKGGEYYWINYGMARYYGLKEINLEE